jgi:hypothetical protein
MARRSGAVIEAGKIIPHPDGKGGMLHHTGFVQTFDPNAPQKPASYLHRNHPELGTTFHYRDDHGNQHPIPVNDIRRVADASGKFNYHFNVNGKPVAVPEGDKPLFQVEAANGKRFTQAADGSRLELGADPNAAAQAGIAPREAAALKSRDDKLARGSELSRQLKEKQALAAAAQQRYNTAQQKLEEINKAHFSSDPKEQAKFTSEQMSAARQEFMEADSANNKHTDELKQLQDQHDAHYRALVADHRARHAELGQVKGAAATGPADATWQQDARSIQGDTRASDLSLIDAAEKTDPATAAAVRKALLPAPASRVFDAAEKSFGTSPQPGDSTAAGKSMSLHDMLMQAPEMKPRGGKAVDQAAAARSTAQSALGISDPENVRVTRTADGTYSLSRPATDGSGTQQPFATLDPRTNRLTLTPGADGKYSQAAQDMAAQASPGGIPIHHSGTQPPMSEAERRDLIQKGLQATTSNTDRKQADAALTKAGLSPEGIQQRVQQGRLSAQDGKLLNDKFNSGVSSYTDRQAAETAQQQDASLEQLHQDSKGTKDKPNFQSWMDKGDPQRDAKVKEMAQKLGKSEDDIRRDLETRRITDWSTPLSQASHDQQSGLAYGLGKKLGLTGLAEPTRTLPDGSIMPNPELGNDRAKFDEAIDASLGTKEAKEKAKGLWEKYHNNYLTNVRSALETMQTLPGVENYTAWRERMQKGEEFNHLTENQKAEKYMDEQKGRPWYTKLADNVSSNLLAGSHDLVAGIAGTAGLLTGSQTISDFAAEKAGHAEQSTAALQHTGNDGTVNNIVGGVVRAVPGMAAAAATGGTTGAAAVGFTQGAGSTYTDLYKHGIQQGLSPAKAHAAAFGTAIASGAVSAVLGKVFSGGANALNNPATREAAKKSFGTVMKSVLKGAADEIPQEVLDSGFNHIASEMNKGRTFQEATASYAEQFPQSALTVSAITKP